MSEFRLLMWLREQYRNNDKLSWNERVMIKTRIDKMTEKHMKF